MTLPELAEPPMATPPAPAPQVISTNTMAILSLVFAFIFAPLGVVFGYIARKQIRTTREGGSGLALAGLIVGWIGVGFFCLWCLFMVIAIAANSGSGY